MWVIFRGNMWFMYDEALAHFYTDARLKLDNKFVIWSASIGYFSMKMF